MDWRAAAKRAIPSALLNNLLLTFPALYRTGIVRYETTLADGHGIDDLVSQLEHVLHLEGEIIECGSSRCGASVIMAYELRARGVRKTIYACDSFTGFDRVELANEQRQGLTGASDTAFTSTSLAYVKRKLHRLGVDDAVLPVQGFFRDTLPQLDSPLCFALVDCDLRESMTYCAETLWPKLVAGARMVFDDYCEPNFRGAKLAVDAFVARHGSEIAEHGLLRRLYCVRKC
jgi:O-methyltransferase